MGTADHSPASSVPAALAERPFPLTAIGAVWLVRGGSVDVFAVPWKDGAPAGAWHYLLRVAPGQMLVGIDSAKGSEGQMLLAAPSAGARLERLPRTAVAPAAAAELIDRWLEDLSAALAAYRPLPRTPLDLRPNETQTLENQEGRPSAGVLWATLRQGTGHFLGMEDVPLPADMPVPLCPRTWVRAAGTASVACSTTTALVESGQVWAAVDAFHRMALQVCALHSVQESTAERQRLAQRLEAETRTDQAVQDRLAAILTRQPPPAPVEVSDPLVAACWLVGRAAGIAIRAPRAESDAAAVDHPVQRIARAANAQTREVRLEEGWWRGTAGPLLGFVPTSRDNGSAAPAAGRPVALLNDGPEGRYTLCDPVTGSRTPLTAALAGTLAPIAYTFYRPLPQGPITPWGLLRFGLFGSSADVAWVLALSALAGLLGMLVPYLTGLLFSTIIPAANQSMLVQVAAMLLVAALVTAVFRVVRGIAMARVLGRLEASTEAALWDRLLALPAAFFRKYTAGELATRANSINQVRGLLTAATTTALLALISGPFNLAMLFYYSPRLALWSLALLLVPVLATLLIARRQFAYARRWTEINGKLQSWVLQMITGIAKLRVSGAERRMFACWSQRFADYKEAEYQTQLGRAGLATCNAGWEVLNLLVIFGLAVLWKPSDVQAPAMGDLLGFISASSGLTAIVTGAVATIIPALAMIPLFEFARPILEAPPEVHPGQTAPGDLTGAIQVQHLRFGYQPDLPLVLQDVSLKIEPGEFIALVGPSGSGKSTLLRLLLGFETPQSGSVFYDGSSLANVDVRAVRRQVGTVLQHATVMAGSLFDNIAGSQPLSLDDAWAAARMAGLDADIQQMPMGMQTLVNQGGSTLSGGQRQRLLIARALARRPSILLFDEATSALDNRTQDVVRQSLEKLQVTRVVIAHRLSTVRHADRICVFESGRIVQTGSPAELLAQPGLFAEMARRQQFGDQMTFALQT